MLNIELIHGYFLHDQTYNKLNNSIRTLLFFFSLFDPGEDAEVGLSPTDFPLFALITDSCWALDSCIYAYKCINGQLNHSLGIVRKSDIHSYNTRNKDTIKLPKIKYNWGKHRSRYHCFIDSNELERTVRNSASLPIFKKCLFSAFYN